MTGTVARDVWRAYQKPPHATNRRGTIAVALLVLAAFGPYVVGGLRTEQIAVYAFAAVAVLTAPTAHGFSLGSAGSLRLLGTWATLLGVAAAGAIGVPLPAPWPSGSAVAGLDNVALPVAVMLAVWLLVRPEHADRLLTLAAKLIAGAMAANGVLSMAMTQYPALTGALRPFWAVGTNDVTADFAAQLGRYSGVFNQPAEAGTAYGLAAICCWYAWRDRPRAMYMLLIPIVLGGFICVSKVFIIGGLPLLLWLIWRRRGGGRLGLLFVVAAGALVLTQTQIADSWIGLGFLKRLLNPDEGLLAFYSANRVGEASDLGRIVHEVMRTDPWFGFGAPGLAVPYDSAWVEALVVAGAVGVACYALTLLWLWLSARADPSTDRRRMVTAVVVLTVGGSFGLPVLTANRVATLLWLVLALAVAAGAHQRRQDGNRSESGQGVGTNR